MCLDCGCKLPDTRHGDERHLIMQDLVDAAKASKQDTVRIFKNMEEATRMVFEGKLQSESWKPGS